MTPEREPGTPDASSTAEVEARIRRAARLMTGSWQGVDEIVAGIEARLRALEAPPLDEQGRTRELWRAVAAELLNAPRRPQPLEAPLPTDPPARRLAPALAALPLQQRLAMVLVHQCGLGLVPLADAMGVAPVVAEGLLRQAQEELAEAARRWGDEVSFPTSS